MKIGFLTDNYPFTGDAPSSPPGGIGTYTKLVADELAGRGRDVHVFAFASVSRQRATKHKGVTIWQCPAYSKRRQMTLASALEFTIRYRNQALMLNRYSMLCAARNAAQGGKFDVIEAADLGAMGELVRDAGIGRHYSVRLHCSTNFGRIPAAAEDLPEMKRIERNHALTADSLSAPSEYTVAMTQRVWHTNLSRVTVVGNPVVAVPDVSVRGDPKSVVFFGRLSWQKGVDVLVQAMGLLRNTVPGLKLTLIGPDQPWPTGCTAVEFLTKLAVEEGIIDRLTFVPAMTHDRLRDELRRHGVVVLPSRDETFGNVVVEAMMWGLPCILSDLPVFREIGTHESDCLMFQKDDARSLADAIGRMLVDDDLQCDLRARAYQRAQTWRVDRVVDQLMGVWNV